MKTTYDIYNQLQQDSVMGVEYISITDSIAYSTPELSVQACKNGKRLQVDLAYDGQTFCCTAPDCENVYHLFYDLANQKITVDRISEVSIILKGYHNKKTPRFSKLKAVILSVIGILLGIFSLMMCLALPLGTMLFDEPFDWSLMAVNLIFAAALFIAFSLVKYAVLQHKYKRQIWMVITGYAMTGFWSSVAAMALIEDFDRTNGYSADTIGGLVVMAVFISVGVLMLVFSKRRQGEKTMTLYRIPTLPAISDADAIFHYMERACSQGKLPFETISSTGREADHELELFMKYSADQLSIAIDETLLFDELLTALSQDAADSFENSNVAKYYYYCEYA